MTTEDTEALNITTANNAAITTNCYSAHKKSDRYNGNYGTVSTDDHGSLFSETACI